MKGVSYFNGTGGAEDLNALPLCVDMDGTLLRIDTLHEAAFAAISADWRVAPRLIGWLFDGKVRVKQELSKLWDFDPSKLPYNKSILEYLHAQRGTGRRLVLCTAAHRDIAERVARYLNIFDEVIATEGTLNLRGPTKADVLCCRFGRGKFIYAGNDASDHAVWECAAAAIVVNASGSVQRAAQARHRVISLLDGQTNIARSVLRAMRPYQWVKNALCLIPLLAAGDFTDTGAWAAALMTALSFCLVASGIYLLNDIFDLAADRAHPRKSSRPFANGDLSVAIGLILSPILLLGGLAGC